MKELFSNVLANRNQAVTIYQVIACDSHTEQFILHEKSVYKTIIHKMENHIEMNNKHSFDKSNAIAAKKSKKEMIDVESNKESNRSKAKVSQSIH